MSRQQQTELQQRPNRGQRHQGRPPYPSQRCDSRRGSSAPSRIRKPYDRPIIESRSDIGRRSGTQHTVIESPSRRIAASEADFGPKSSTPRRFIKAMDVGESEPDDTQRSSTPYRFMKPNEIVASGTDLLRRSTIVSKSIKPSSGPIISSESRHRRRSSTPSISMQLFPRQIAASGSASPAAESTVANRTGATASIFMKPSNHKVAAAGSASLAIRTTASQESRHKPAKAIQTCCRLKEEIHRRIELKRKNGASAKQIAYTLFHLEYESSPYADYGTSRTGHPYLTSDEAMKATIHIETHNALNQIKKANSIKVIDEFVCQDLDNVAESTLSDLGKNLKKVYHDHSLITNAALRMELHTLTEKNMELNESNLELSNKMEQLKNDKASETRCRALETALDGLRNDHLLLREEYRKLIRDHEQLQDHYERLENDAKSMQDAYASLTEESKMSQKIMKDDVAALVKRLKRYESDESHKRFD